MLHSVRDDLYPSSAASTRRRRSRRCRSTNPLVGWIWFGAIILIFGSFVCLWPELQPEESRAWRFARGAGAVATSITLGLVLALLPVPAFAQNQATQQAGSVQMDTPQERHVFGSLRCMWDLPRELLSSCACSTADQTRERLRGRLAKGEEPQHIIDDYVQEYGTGALAIPPDKGAMKAIHVVPPVAIRRRIAPAFVLKRWRKNNDGSKKKSDDDDAPKRDKPDDRIDQELEDPDDE